MEPEREQLLFEKDVELVAFLSHDCGCFCHLWQQTFAIAIASLCMEVKLLMLYSMCQNMLQMSFVQIIFQQAHLARIWKTLEAIIMNDLCINLFVLLNSIVAAVYS